MTTRDRDFADAALVVEHSVLVRTAARLAAGIEAAAARSASARLIRRLRVTRIGVVIASGCVTHAALLQVVPARIAPARPLAYGMVLAFAAFATVAGLVTRPSRATAAAESSAGTANAMKS